MLQLLCCKIIFVNYTRMMQQHQVICDHNYHCDIMKCNGSSGSYHIKAEAVLQQQRHIAWKPPWTNCMLDVLRGF